MTREELAQLVLDMLAGQQKYFRDRSSENLVVWKQAERKVKEACEALVKPQARLFE